MILNVTKINLTGGTQARVGINDNTAEEYADLMIDGVEFPPITVFFDGVEYWLADGWHRLSAAIIAAKDTVEAEVIEGSRRDAVLYAVGANAGHGLRRTNADKRRAVMMLLEDAEWVQWSNYKIAEKCAVSEGTVRNIRDSLRNLRSDDEQPTSPRAYTDKHGNTSVMDTSNIGKSQKPTDYAEFTAIPQQSSATIEPGYYPLDDHSNYESTDTYDPQVEVYEYYPVGMIPKKMMEVLDEANKLCDEQMVNSWSLSDRVAVKSKLTLLKSRIDYLLLNI